AAVDSLKDERLKYRITHLVSRLFFRGIYFPQMTRRAWLKLFADNRRTIYRLAKEGLVEWRAGKKEGRLLVKTPVDER
ncbi:MAG TPA: hypothetical protein VD861_02230, partial [Pyrinomonadaceae bacterium]|nr:hypothetical protein [Pyrinomonadaceae bacterium]